MPRRSVRRTQRGHTDPADLLFLPFQLEPILGWTSPLAVGIAAFLFLGFLAIGEAIQSPFGYDRCVVQRVACSVDRKALCASART